MSDERDVPCPAEATPVLKRACVACGSVEDLLDTRPLCRDGALCNGRDGRSWAPGMWRQELAGMGRNPAVPRRERARKVSLDSVCKSITEGGPPTPKTSDADDHPVANAGLPLSQQEPTSDAKHAPVRGSEEAGTTSGEAPAITGSREGDGPVRGGGTTPQTAAISSTDEACKAPTPDELHRAAQALLRMMWLYSGYPVKSRGPVGCVHDALRVLSPQLQKRLEDGEEPGDLLDQEEA